jgi:hypothetical protein
MYSDDNDITLREKIKLLHNLLENSDQLAGMTEGSKVIVLIVDPKDESEAVRELNNSFDDSVEYIDASDVLLKVTDEYGLDELKSDKKFFKESYMEIFSDKLLNAIISEITQKTSKKTTIIHRIGILNGILRLTPIIESIAGKLTFPLVVVYPGKKKDNLLHFLEKRHVTSIYRAEVI